VNVPASAIAAAESAGQKGTIPTKRCFHFSRVLRYRKAERHWEEATGTLRLIWLAATSTVV